MASIELGTAVPSDIDGILALQEENQLEHGGLLSARLPRAWFEAALNDLPIIVARRSERVVGYLVTASREATQNVPMIAAMLRACRTCHNLGYASDCEDTMDRAMRRAGKVKLRLGGDPDWLAPFPPKPPRMWWRTHERMCRRYREAEARVDNAF